MSDAFSAVVGQLRFVSPEAAPHFADIAQLAEHLICNQGVGGSTPSISTSVAEPSVALNSSKDDDQEAILPPSLVLKPALPRFRPHRLAVRTSAFHAENTGSNPVGVKDFYFNDVEPV